MHRYITKIVVGSSGFLFFDLYFFPILTHFGDEKMEMVTLNVRTFSYERKKRQSWSSKRIWLLLFTLFRFLILILLCQEAKCGNSSCIHTHTHKRELYAQIRLLCFAYDCCVWYENCRFGRAMFIVHCDVQGETFRSILYSSKGTIGYLNGNTRTQHKFFTHNHRFGTVQCNCRTPFFVLFEGKVMFISLS